MPRPSSLDAEADAVAAPCASCDRDPAAVGRVLDRVVDEVRQHLAQLVGSAATGGRLGAAPRPTSSTVVRGVRAQRRRRRSRASSRRVAALDRDAHLARVEPARPEDVVDDAREPVRLARDHVEQPVALRLLEPRRRCAAASAPRRRSRRAACAARARPSRRSRSSAARPRAPRSGRGTRRPCRPGTAPPRSRASAPRPARRPAASAARACRRSGSVATGIRARSVAQSRISSSIAAADRLRRA